MTVDTHAEHPQQVASLQQAIRRHMRYSLGRGETLIGNREMFKAVALAVRDRLMDQMIDTEERYRTADAKRVYYLSMEFLLGRLLENNLANLGLLETCREAVAGLGADWDQVVASEPDPALGNGGLGRLAACFLDSMATLGIPGHGYGINYEFGLFRQEISDGYQREKSENWLRYGTPWEVERSDKICLVPIYGRIDHARDRAGQYNPMWLDWGLLVGLPYDMPIAGYGGRAVNFMRLYAARSSHEFDMRIFNEGDYIKAVEDKVAMERVTKVLYPSDALEAGRELRLVQEYFLVACALRDIISRYETAHDSFDRFPDKVAIQLNDTHPTLAVPELLRILVDENSIPWERAWDITCATFGYTNHTLLPEALERWPVHLIERVAPRHMQIIHEINRRFLEQVSVRWPGDFARRRRMSLIEEGYPKRVRMANLAIVGSHSVNGVSQLHTDLVKSALVPDFHDLWPDRFNNKTNGVTPRRWLLVANPKLAALLDETVGRGWITDLDLLRALEAHADDPAFQERVLAIKRANKERLAAIIRDETGVAADPDSLFDIQVKRIHEYKRQTLNVMQIIHEYLRLIEDGQPPAVPRTFVFAGKAAPGYWAAKQIIKLIHSVGRVINVDPRAHEWLKVVFLADYRVTLAEKIIPAADLSEQISTAGTEASGTGNMKFALNGALTMGTYDGANIEIAEEAGDENLYIFGLRADEIQRLRGDGSYHPRQIYEQTPWLRRILDALKHGHFSPEAPQLFEWLFAALVDRGDPYFHLADLPAYVEAQDRADADYLDRPVWARKAILNVARVGKFSSDRTIREYAAHIWGTQPVA